LLMLGYYVRQAGVILGSVLIVPGAFIAAFSIFWVYFLPFRDGFDTGIRCLRSSAQRQAWWRNNRDYQLKRPGVRIFQGLLMVGLAVLLFNYSGRGQDHLNQPAPAGESPRAPRTSPTTAPTSNASRQ
jgi:hypothetical protein